MPGKERLGERLGALQRRSGARGAEEAETTARLEGVYEPEGERPLRPDHRQVDPLTLRQVDDRGDALQIVRATGTHVGEVARCPALPGARHSDLEPRALRELPGERVLAAPASRSRSTLTARSRPASPLPSTVRAGDLRPSGCPGPAR